MAAVGRRLLPEIGRRRRVEEVFRNTAYRLLHLTLRSSGGVEQTLLTTAEHPAYVLGQGWMAAGKLKAGDTISEPGGGFSSVVACRSQEYPEGIEVFNLRVQESHTYFVRAEGSTAEPVWVHNSYDSNNLKGGTYENVRASAVAREGEMPFFRAGKTTTRRGGFDMVTLAEDGMVTIEESKFQNRLQFDDFTAITENLRGNVQEVFDSLGGMNTISRANKMTIRSALGNFLDGQVPSNLRIRVASGKAVIGPRLQSRIGANTGGIPVVFQ